MMKSALVVLFAAVALPGAALAQTTPPPGAAATLPNTFDQPDVARPAPAQALPPVEAGDPAQVAAAERMLRTTIAALQAGAPNYADMTSDLASKVRQQQAAITPLIQGFGALRTVGHVGVDRGMQLFAVTFANTATQWVIGLDDQGKIVGLLFRPAPATPPASGG